MFGGKKLEFTKKIITVRCLAVVLIVLIIVFFTVELPKFKEMAKYEKNKKK